jgi:hypothetical protein
MTLAWVFGSSALLSAGVSLYEGSQQSSIASGAQQLAQVTQGEQQQYNKQLMSLLANPQTILSNPAFLASTQLGEQAVAHQMGAAFGGNSTTEAAALLQYGQGAGLSFLTSQEQLLASLSGAQTASPPANSYSAASSAAGNAASTVGSNLYGAGALLGMGYNGMGYNSSSPGTIFSPSDPLGSDPNFPGGAGSLPINFSPG